jgi:hypothetical protein
LATPDRIDTSIGTLNLVDGVPKPDTVEKIYDTGSTEPGAKHLP